VLLGLLLVLFILLPKLLPRLVTLFVLAVAILIVLRCFAIDGVALSAVQGRDACWGLRRIHS
jgi:hypothetical protein